jgi:hypothetical protein
MATYKIHPGIGIARLGNSDTEFYLAPETPAGLPIECDNNGNPRFGSDGITPVLVTTFRARRVALNAKQRGFRCLSTTNNLSRDDRSRSAITSKEAATAAR